MGDHSRCPMCGQIRPARRKKFPQIEFEKLVASGVSSADIAQKLGYCYSTIHKKRLALERKNECK
jgi:DNA-binding NarL/FixJ family response regulator